MDTKDITDKTTKELQTLFDHSNPSSLKRSLLDVYFLYITTNVDYTVDIHRISEDIYQLVIFFDKLQQLEGEPE